jgi:hypothetical protein
MSHTFKNLKERVEKPSEEADICARNVPLVHCIREHAELENVISLLKTGFFCSLNSKPKTTSACKKLGIPEGSMFFYVGRSFPENGVSIAILYGGAYDIDKNCVVIESQIMSNNSSPICRGVRPFDSGGLAEEKLRFSVTKEELKTYFNEHNDSDLKKWRDYFSRFITEFFASPAGYWQSYPTKDIDGINFTKNDDWRNWTFEIHSKWSVPVSLAGRIFVKPQIERSLQNSVGFRNNTRLAPVVSALIQYCPSPTIEAERQAFELSVKTQQDGDR